MAGLGVNGPVLGYLHGPAHALPDICVAGIRSPVTALGSSAVALDVHLRTAM